MTEAQLRYQEKLKDPRWKAKRLEILTRDEFSCKSCNRSPGELHIHHKHYLAGREPWEYHNDLLITLCNDCHQVEERNRKQAYQRLTETIAEAGFTREDVEKLTLAFSNIRVLPLCSETLMSKIYRAINAAWDTYTPTVYGKEDNG